MIVYSQWCRIEGNVIPDLDKEYGVGTLKNLDKQKIFYGTPEIEIHNPSSIINGCRYMAIPVSSYGWNNIKDIDANYDAVMTKIQQQDKSANLGVVYYKPFVVTESSIIFHNDSTKSNLDLIGFVWVDQYATPELKKINAYYDNKKNVKVGDEFDVDDLVVTAIYSDASTAKIESMGYKIYNSKGEESKVVSAIGSNTFTIVYETGGKTFTTSFIVPGIKKIIGLNGIYDGPAVGYGESVKKKYFVITILYSDGSSTGITDFTFPNGTIVTKENNGVINVFYQGFTAAVSVKTFEVASSFLLASYNGPNVEVGKEFLISHVAARIYYEASDSSNNYYEEIDAANCEIVPTRISNEGANYITISYTGKLGTISSQFTVMGIKPDVVLNYITASYTGPDVTVGGFFDVSKIICKGYYSNGSVVMIKGFSINSNVISNVGDNTFVIVFENKSVKLVINGLAKEDTTGTSFNEIKIDNQYPAGTMRNYRYRGPMESDKVNDLSVNMQENIQRLYSRFQKLEAKTNEIATGLSENVYDTYHKIKSIQRTMEELNE